MKSDKKNQSLDFQGIQVALTHLARNERLDMPSHGHLVSSSGNHRTNSTIPCKSGIAALCHDLH